MARVVAWIAGIGHVLAGLWALAAPESFFDKAAVFEPYNQHFIQDVGSFLVGLGAVLLIAVVVSADALTVSLLGVGIASATHTVSHIIGRDLGGEPARDIPALVVVTVALLAGGWARAKEVRASG